jgi:hypothetical protein
MEANVRKLFIVTRKDEQPSTKPTYAFMPVWTIDKTFFPVVSEGASQLCDNFKAVQPNIQSFCE